MLAKCCFQAKFFVFSTILRFLLIFFFFFFNDPAPPEIYPLPLPDALPICERDRRGVGAAAPERSEVAVAVDSLEAGHYHYVTCMKIGANFLLVDGDDPGLVVDRKSTRLNSSHSQISYAVFCLKKKKNKHHI